MKKIFIVKLLGWGIIFANLLFWILFHTNFHGFWLAVNVLYSLITIIVGVGIILLKSWARRLLLLMVAIKVLDFLIRLPINIITHKKLIIEIIVDGFTILFVAIFVFWFFNRKFIKEQFKYPRE